VFGGGEGGNDGVMWRKMELGMDWTVTPLFIVSLAQALLSTRCERVMALWMTVQTPLWIGRQNSGSELQYAVLFVLCTSGVFDSSITCYS
jgi:hypothetical protein